MMRNALRFTSTVLLSALALVQPVSLASQSAPTAQGTLTPEASVRDTLAAGTSHSWQLSAAVGRFVVIEVETSTVDVVVRVLDAAGELVREIDGPGAQGIERARWLTNAAGTWTVQVVPFDAEGPGEYEIRWVLDRAPMPEDVITLRLDSLNNDAGVAYREGTSEGRERAIALWSEAAALYRRAGDRADEAKTLHSIGEAHYGFGRPDSALAYYAHALSIRRAVGDRAGEAATLNHIGRVHHDLSRPDSALAYFARALPIARAAGDRAEEATALSNIGAVHSALGRPDSALAYYAQTLPIRRAVSDPAGEAATLQNIGVVHYGLGRPDSTLAYFTRSLPIWRAVGERANEASTLSSIGVVYNRLGRPDSALAYYAHALSIQRAVGNRAGEAATLQNIGTLHWASGRPDTALDYYTQALPLQRAVGDRAAEARTLSSIGTVHSDLGRPDSALSYYTQALSIRRAVVHPAGDAATLHNIGSQYRALGRPDSALAYFTQALSIRRAIGDRAGEAETLNGIGAVHSALGRPDSALAYYAQALSIQRAISERADEAVTLNNIGAVHYASGRPDSALAYYTQSLSIQRAVGERAVEAATLNNIGRVHHALGRPDSAIAYYAQALPIRRAVGDRAGEAGTLGNIARVHQHSSPARPRIAVAYYDSAAAVLASVAARAGGDQNRLSFAEQQVSIYADWTLASLALADEIGPAASARAALAAGERGRAQALLDLMRRSASDASGTVGSSAATTAIGADLVQQGARLVESLRRTGSTALVYLVAGDTLLTWLIDPKGNVSVSRQRVTAEELADEVAALRIGLDADRAAVRSRFATRGAPDLDPVPRGIGTRPAGIARGSRAVSRLSAWLIPPTLREKLAAAGELLIVPHGPLNLLPFAVLPADTSGEPLGVRYSLRYAPSLATLAALADSSGRGPAPPRGAAIVVGNPVMPRVRSPEGEEVMLGPLAGAEAEARWVADRVGAAALHGASATEVEIKRQLPSATLIHLATHGYAYSSEARARDSFIALAPSSGEDGLLTVGEVLDAIPPLRAELVVLSACQTGLGDLKQAEGTVGLQRAFLAKGARSVLVSLWSVSDEATEQLMRSFYTHWRSGASKADALRRAQTEVRGAPGSPFHHPRFWAAFVLVGTSR